jgi:hypothetical protein
MTMFSVQGTYDGVAYTLVVDRTAEPPLSGSPRILTMLTLHEGLTVDVTPTGPYLTVDLGDDETIMGALLALTEVRTTDGDVPDPVGPTELGALY